jgi:hypothetical protein
MGRLLLEVTRTWVSAHPAGNIREFAFCLVPGESVILVASYRANVLIDCAFCKKEEQPEETIWDLNSFFESHNSMGGLAMRVLALVLLSCACVFAKDPEPPIFGPRMTAPFNQTIRIIAEHWRNHVDFFYDSTVKPIGVSLYRHSRGQHDEICTGIKGKEWDEAPCNLLAAADGWRYVIYPETKECCRVCNVSSYCGIISPDWLKTGAVYQGKKEINGAMCEGWMKKGGEENYYWVTADSKRIPCQYYEGYPNFVVGSNYWNFEREKYSDAPIPSSTFAIPQGWGCDKHCDVRHELVAKFRQQR